MKADGLRAEVEGDIDEVEGVLRIARIRLKFRFRAAPEERPTIDRVLDVFARGCPAWQSVKDCIACSWTAELD